MYHNRNTGRNSRVEIKAVRPNSTIYIYRTVFRDINLFQHLPALYIEAAIHGWPYQCNRQSCCLHGAKMQFLAWHRTLVLNFEEGISR